MHEMLPYVTNVATKSMAFGPSGHRRWMPGRGREQSRRDPGRDLVTFNRTERCDLGVIVDAARTRGRRVRAVKGMDSPGKVCGRSADEHG